MKPETILIAFLIAAVMYLLYKQYEEYTLEESDPKLIELKNAVAPLFSKTKKYSGLLSPINDRDVLSEIKLYKGNKSYTINKEKVFLCLKDKQNEYYNDNLLKFVFLHELSHVITDEIGHTKKFNQIFDELLKEASKMGIYDSKMEIDPNYCQ